MLARGIPGESLESASLPPRNHLDHGPKRSSCSKGPGTLQICHLKVPKPSSFPTGKLILKIQNGEIAHPTCERLMTGSSTEHSGGHQRQHPRLDRQERFAVSRAHSPSSPA